MKADDLHANGTLDAIEPWRRAIAHEQQGTMPVSVDA